MNKYKDVIDAYSDSNLFSEEGRDLNFIGLPMDLLDWHATMKWALTYDYDTPPGYNNFLPGKVFKALYEEIGEGLLKLTVWPAREGSPAVYITGPEETMEGVKAALGKAYADEVGEANIDESSEFEKEWLEKFNTPEDREYPEPYEVGREQTVIRGWWD